MLNRIKKMCDKQNMSFAALERAAGLTRGSITKWDKSAPSIDKAQKVADYFGVTLDYLIGRTDDPYTTAELNEEEMKVFNAYMKARQSDRPALKVLAKAFEQLLKLDEE